MKEEILSGVEKIYNYMGWEFPETVDLVSDNPTYVINEYFRFERLQEVIDKMREDGFKMTITVGEDFGCSGTLCSVLLPHDLISTEKPTRSEAVFSAIVQFLDYLPFEEPIKPAHETRKDN